MIRQRPPLLSWATLNAVVALFLCIAAAVAMVAVFTMSLLGAGAAGPWVFGVMMIGAGVTGVLYGLREAVSPHWRRMCVTDGGVVLWEVLRSRHATVMRWEELDFSTLSARVLVDFHELAREKELGLWDWLEMGPWGVGVWEVGLLGKAVTGELRGGVFIVTHRNPRVFVERLCEMAVEAGLSEGAFVETMIRDPFEL